MALTFGFFLDAALTTPIASAPQFVQAVTSPTPADKVVYFGSPTAGRVAKRESNPGTDPILVSASDSSSGTGSPASDVKLALTAGGLASATGGAALNIGTTVEGGAVNAVPIHIRVTDSTHVAALNTDLSIVASTIAEFVE